MDNKTAVNIFWFRRDLRLQDNAGLYHALKAGLPVLPIFIFDTLILDQLPDRDDARVTFIYDALTQLNEELQSVGSSILTKHGTPLAAFEKLCTQFDIRNVFANSDYEPYATARDSSIQAFLESRNISFCTFKDHLIFEKDEVMKENGSPYTVFSPYKRKWYDNLVPDFHFKAYPSEKYLANFYKQKLSLPGIEKIEFTKSVLPFPGKNFLPLLQRYHLDRDIPSIPGTTKIGVHLRFGTVSIRELGRQGLLVTDKTWLGELIWRDFYAMILWHYPHTAQHSFKQEYDKISWRNSEEEFNAWCEGKTGYPLVDAGMRQLNATGWMHNRVRMVVASFLTKHLLIDWRWGETYFSRKLIDYDQASNVGGWQWAAGTGNDAVPYFRIFNPELQTKKFDPNYRYIRRWIPEIEDPFSYPRPIVDHRFARERALKEYRKALGSKP